MSNERMSLNDIQHALMKALYRPGSPVTSDETDAAMDALGGLVAAEADGRLVILPCNIGERVYEIFRTSDCNGFHNCLCLCSGMIEGHKVMEPCPYYDAETDDCKGAFDKNREWNVRCVAFRSSGSICKTLQKAGISSLPVKKRRPRWKKKRRRKRR